MAGTETMEKCHPKELWKAKGKDLVPRIAFCCGRSEREGSGEGRIKEEMEAVKWGIDDCGTPKARYALKGQEVMRGNVAEDKIKKLSTAKHSLSRRHCEYCDEKGRIWKMENMKRDDGSDGKESGESDDGESEDNEKQR